MPGADVVGELEALALVAELDPVDPVEALVPVEVPDGDETVDEEDV